MRYVIELCYYAVNRILDRPHYAVQQYQWIHINATYDPEFLSQAKGYARKTSSSFSGLSWWKGHAVQFVELLSAWNDDQYQVNNIIVRKTHKNSR